MSQSFGKWLLETRKAKGLTQEQLAKKAGVSKPYIGHLENSRPHSTTDAPPQPAKDKVIAIAEALNEDVDSVLLLAGFAPISEVEATRNRIVVSDKDGFDEQDLLEISEFIAFKKSQKEKKNEIE